jgi:hypothetical protein
VVTNLDPNPPSVYWTQDFLALAPSGSILYVSGEFGELGGAPRANLGALDLGTGRATDWSPYVSGAGGVYPRVDAVAPDAGLVYVGGSYPSIAGKARRNMAAIDSVTGVPTEWDPGPDGEVFVIEKLGDRVFAGGSFGTVDGVPHSGLIAIIGPEAPAARFANGARKPGRTSLDDGFSLSSAPTATVRFSLAESTPVSLSVYDVGGRRVATIAKGETSTAGVHEVAIRTTGWPTGVYFCRLETPKVSATRKLLVLK